MAYMNQERKKALAPAIKAVFKEYGVKATLAVGNHSTIVANIKKGPVDFGEYTHGDGYIQVNPYHVDTNYEGEAREFLRKLVDAMNAGNHDRSDIQTDYFDVGWYVRINVGNWNKPYECTAPTGYFGGLPIVEHIDINALPKPVAA